MKPRIVAGTFAKMPASPEGKPENLIGKIRKVTAELQSLQAEFYRAVANEDGLPRDFGLLASCSEELSAFKTAIDQLRYAMWFYSSATSGEDSAHALGKQTPETQDHQLQPQSRTTLIESGSFFDRLNLVIEGYIQMNGLSSGRRKSST